MRDYAKVAPSFWTRGSGKRLRGDPEAQVLALYVVTCPSANMIGVYYVPLVSIAHETGLGLDKTRSALARLAAADFAHYDEDAELVYVPNMASYQIGDEMKPGDKRRGGVLGELDKLGSHRFVAMFRQRYGRAYALSTRSESSPLQGPSEIVSSTSDDTSEASSGSPLEGPSDEATSPFGPETRSSGRAGEEQEKKINHTPIAGEWRIVAPGCEMPDVARVDFDALTLTAASKLEAEREWEKFVDHCLGLETPKTSFPSNSQLLAWWRKWIRKGLEFERRDRVADASKAARASRTPSPRGPAKQPGGSARWFEPDLPDVEAIKREREQGIDFKPEDLP